MSFVAKETSTYCFIPCNQVVNQPSQSLSRGTLPVPALSDIVIELPMQQLGILKSERLIVTTCYKETRGGDKNLCIIRLIVNQVFDPPSWNLSLQSMLNNPRPNLALFHVSWVKPRTQVYFGPEKPKSMSALFSIQLLNLSQRLATSKPPRSLSFKLWVSLKSSASNQGWLQLESRCSNSAYSYSLVKRWGLA